ncbi:hypothetical protein AUJ66_03235 [Candidatus Desantisbacteria bacterium CG1_02_38_46]|uniref:Neutral/alkaline non-lysosomal ceramidase N-terminal domain-containing protein n=3 Tax=unclassified Candidatus Desantisiibacteriota TaxID=3106372 RepID=A0A2H9P9E5_9BACT|nr:MAG: hypothetical protein AUJ66_03235 [Candidatus Desantisbacteria bacterium CG1_02_38_46]PIU51295.1 MAG: hypothetical protein COS91_04950 [Candidatus Desantisbacteria bacterium CG07_land_8_20_14_0_80_39_15]PIZ14779.1 MAG: hypothetical protein COY51_07315 [Candidatus Desantisbacteria bacterium CG_4_10_14_0_8_um_filter_39_17]
MSVYAGASRVDISPPKGTSMMGYFHERRSEGVHDPIFSNALVLSDGNKKIAIVSVDLCALQLPMTQKIRKIAERKTGIPKNNILIHCTHIHTGPTSVTRLFDRIPYEKEWTEQTFVKKVAESIVLANSRLKEVRIGFGNGRENTIAFNRRYWLKEGIVRTNPGFLNPNIIRPAGPIDPQVGVIKIEDLNGELKALIVHYTCHSDTVGGNLISAGYLGYTRKVIRDIVGEGVEIICLNGACGDINHINVKKFPPAYRKRYFGQAKYMGTLLGAEALKVIEKIKMMDEDCKIGAMLKPLRIKHRKISNKDVGWAKRVLKANPEELEKICDEKTPIMGMRDDPLITKTYAKSILRLSSLKNKWEDTEIQVIRIGKGVIVGVPCEFFVELGLEIKKKSPFKPWTFIAELANDWVGYVPTKKAFSEGGYETMLGSSSWAEQSAGDKMVKLSLGVLKELGGDNG